MTLEERAVANQNIFGSMNGWNELQTRLNRAAKAAFAGVFLGLLASCGGSGVSAPTVVGGDLQVLPGATDMFPNTPVTFTISGGQRPYTAFSSNSSILPLDITIASGSTFVATANNPTTDTVVTITVRDSAGKTATAAASVKTAVLLNAITIRPSINTGNACGGADVCTGTDAVASVKAQSNGGPLVGRSIRFDVLSGALGIVSGANVASTLTVAADSLGVAIVSLRAPVGVPNQYSTIRATDITTGQSVSYVLTIGQTIDPTAIAITPSDFQWTGAFKDRCASGGLTSHLITGGTPPYSIGQSVPAFSVLTGSPPGPAGQVVPAETVTTVGKNFGSLLVLVTGRICSAGANGNVITVTDSIGRVARLTLGNSLGTADPPAVGAAVVLPVPTLAPSTFTAFACGQASSSFVAQSIPSGYTGTPPILSAVALEPNRITASLSNGILTMTRPNTDPGGGVQTRVRVSNGTNFSDITIDLAGAAPFTCVTGTGATGTPISIAVGTTLALSLAANPNVRATTFTGGSGPYTVTSLGPTIVTVSLDGVTFGTSVTVPASGPFVYFARPIATGATLITIRDSNTTPQSLVQIVTVSP